MSFGIWILGSISNLKYLNQWINEVDDFLLISFVLQHESWLWMIGIIKLLRKILFRLRTGKKSFSSILRFLYYDISFD